MDCQLDTKQRFFPLQRSQTEKTIDLKSALALLRTNPIKMFQKFLIIHHRFCVVIVSIVRQTKKKQRRFIFLYALPTFPLHSSNGCMEKNNIAVVPFYHFFFVFLFFKTNFKTVVYYFLLRRRYHDTKLPCQISHPLLLSCA